MSDLLSEAEFKAPEREYYPETWYHYIGGNVSKPGITADLEAIAQAGISGIQLFHGQFGGEWPGVSPQIQSLSEDWDELVKWTAEECQRLNLRFTMQNCPGWSYAGGPWIEPENSMRHLVYSRTDLTGDTTSAINLEKPRSSDVAWRDYRDLFVIAFPMPEGDTGERLVPSGVTSNRSDLSWDNWLVNRQTITLPPSVDEPTVLDFTFPEKTTLRTVQFPPIDSYAHAWVYAPGVKVTVYANLPGERRQVVSLDMPAANWQDDQPISIACAEVPSDSYRIEITNLHEMALRYIHFYSAARQQNWESEAAWTLRRIVREAHPQQDPRTWIDPATLVDLTGKMDTLGRLDWNVPEGEWTVLRVGHVNTGQKNGPAPAEATGWESTKLHPDGIRANFDGYIGRLITGDGVLKDGLLQGVLLDSWECKTQTWTKDLDKLFEEKWGYSLHSMFPALFGYVVGNPEHTALFLRDWRVTLNDLLVENFFGEMKRLAGEHGLTVSFETASGDVFPGDILEYYKHADIPMCEFWQPRSDSFVGSIEFKPVKPAVSAARGYGKRRVAAEALTSFELTWNEHPRFLKDIADDHFARGVTHLVFHTYTHNPRTDFLPPSTSFGTAIGTPFLRLQTWWKHMPHFTDYLARCNYMLERGRPVSDVLMYLGDEQNHKPLQLLPFPEGYSYDYCNPDMLLNRLSVKDGRLVTPEGIEYRVLWLYDCQRMLPETLEKIASFVKAGVVLAGEAPKGIATLSGGEKANRAFGKAVGKLWGDGSREQLSLGKGKVYNTADIAAVLMAENILPDIVAQSPDLRWLHRQTNGADIYFLSMPPEKGYRGTVLFREMGNVELWDPLSGNIAAVSSRVVGNHTEVELDIPVSNSCFVVFKREGAGKAIQSGEVVHSVKSSQPGRVSQSGESLQSVEASQSAEVSQPGESLQSAEASKPGKVSQQGGASQAVDAAQEAEETETGRVFMVCNQSEPTGRLDLSDASWQLQFPGDWGVETSPLQTQRLTAWKDLPLSDEGKSFSGTVTYETTFTLDQKSASAAYRLNLGRVEVIAKVKVNGKEVGTCWTSPYVLDVTEYLQEGENSLQVEVTSTWFNRLVYDAGLPEENRKTWTIAGPAANDPLKEYGLLGPVTLESVDY